MDFMEEIQTWDQSVLTVKNAGKVRLEGGPVSRVFGNCAFLFVTGNEGNVTLDGNSYPFSSNCLIHLFSGTEVTVDPGAGGSDCWFVEYSAELDQNADKRLISASLALDPFRRCYVMRVEDQEFFTSQFSALVADWAAGSPLSFLRVRMHFYTVLCAVYENFSTGRGKSGSSDIFDYASSFLRENYNKQVSVQELADSLGVSRTTLYERFITAVGTSPKDYLMNLRLDAARQTLESGDMSMDEIAVACGLRDKSYFSRVFKNKFGIPPATYRREWKASHLDPDMPEIGTEIADEDGKVTITNIAGARTFEEAPEKIVCLSYSAAEICAALGVADRITGLASRGEALSDCREEYRIALARSPFIAGDSAESNMPSFETVCGCRPDLVIGCMDDFSRYYGIAEVSAFEEKGIDVYAMRSTMRVGSTFSSVYSDIIDLGRIFRTGDRAQQIIAGMRADEAELADRSGRITEPVRVFVYDSMASGKALTCGMSLEDHIIRAAGGVNVFGDSKRQYTAVTWDEIAAADPQVILVHYYHTRRDSEQKAQFLMQLPELAGTEAVRKDRIFSVGARNAAPSLDCVRTSMWLSDILRGIH